MLHKTAMFADTRFGRIEFFPHDDPIGRSLIEYGEWAELEIRLLCAFIGLGSSVVDVGANVGTHTFALARRVGPTGSVLAFEPQKPVFEMLERNVAANVYQNVRVVHAGVGSSTSEMEVPPVDYFGRANVGGVRLQPASDCIVGERVGIVTIDDFALPACHLVKIDAEGMEADVLRGMLATLERLRPVVFIECNSVTDGAAIMQTGAWAGFQMFLCRIAAFNPANAKQNSANFFGVAHESSLLFVPRELMGSVPQSALGAEVIAISDLDDLSRALLATPRFGDETMYDRNPDKLRDLLAVERRDHADSLRGIEAALIEDRRNAADAIKRLEFRAASLTRQLYAEQRVRSEECASALEGVRQLLSERERQIAALRNSTSWRLTAPLRGLRSALGPERWGRSGEDG